MALNKDVLGLALKNARDAFNDMDNDSIIATYGSLDAARLAMAKADAEEIINHFKNNIQINIPALGIITTTTGNTCTGASTTGIIL